jgi:hypothetical protein
VKVDRCHRSAILAAMKIDPSLYVTVGHAAELADVSRHWMRLQAQAGRVPAVEIDGIWFVLRSAAEAFERHPTAGRPRMSPGKKPRK